MIEIKGVSKKFGSKVAVKDLSLTIPDGEVYGLLGPNGAGKSTTLKMITGILTPDEGDVLISGHSIRKEALEAKKTLAFNADNPDSFLGMKGRDYLAFIASLYGVNKDEAEEESVKYSKMFHIYEALEEQVLSYSHGMRQKIQLVASLIHHPQNWILDEPMTGLDPESTFQVKNLMREYASEGRCVLYSTHVLDVAEKVCDKVAILNKGELVFYGTLTELQQQENESGKSLESLFLEITQ